MTPIQCLKAYFEQQPHGRKVTMDEMKALTKEDRRELAEMCAVAMNVTLEISA